MNRVNREDTVRRCTGLLKIQLNNLAVACEAACFAGHGSVGGRPCHRIVRDVLCGELFLQSALATGPENLPAGRATLKIRARPCSKLHGFTWLLRPARSGLAQRPPPLGMQPAA